MQVIDKSSYITTIYKAIIVNKDINLDPDNKGRVQIYIPSINYEYADYYQEYMADTNKKDSQYYSAFPWATSLIENLNDGDDVYGSYIEGDSSQYIILGLEGGKSKKGNGIGADINTGTLVDLAMGIILHNEIGVEISAWANGTISDEYYSTIVLHDGGNRNSSTGQWISQGCWAIGLIQWNGVRAYDTMYHIAENYSDWEKHFSSESSLKSALKYSLSIKSTANRRNMFSLDSGYNPEKGGSTYNAIKEILSSSKGKEVQNELAKSDTTDTINMLVEEGCTNPAILIYMADFYNQYGTNYPDTTRKSVEACIQSGDMIQQLDWLITNQLKPNFSSFTTYSSRRSTTYLYIKELYNAGELSFGSDLTYIYDGEYLVKNFVKRTIVPSRSDYWYREDIGNPAYSMWGNGGNCTFYAWGRASEILGRKYDGATGNGVDYGNQDGKYKTGNIPKQGAIITWAKKGGGAGHVAIVEDVSQDGQTIWTSESGWQAFMFKYKERANDGNWGAGSSYTFQNFKYII